MELLIMPETFIIFRLFFEHLGYTNEWRVAFNELSPSEKEQILPIIYRNDFNNIHDLTDNERLLNVLKYYKNYRTEIADHNSVLYRLKQEFEERNTIQQDK